MDPKKERKKGKIILFLGLLPYIIIVVWMLLAAIFGYDLCFMVCSGKDYGFDAIFNVTFMVVAFAIAFPPGALLIIIVSILLTISGIIKLKKFPSDKKKKKTNKKTQQ